MNSPFQFTNLVVLAIVFPFAIFSIFYSCYYNRKLDHEAIVEEDYEREIRHDFVNTNSWYLGMFIVTWIPYTLVSYLGYYDPYNCACLDDRNNFISVVKITSLNLVISSAFLSAIVRVTRPIISKKLKERFERKKSAGVLRMLLDDDSMIEGGDDEGLSM
jgi:hypothetical protein